MKKLVSIAFCLISAGAHAQQSLNFNNSPMNFENSPMNFNNSPMNFNNSPMNFNNSPMNFNSTNGIYDNQGNRQGYQVQAPSGVVNYFDNKGNRIGYAPK
jgi:hypothetical protein